MSKTFNIAHLTFSLLFVVSALSFSGSLSAQQSAPKHRIIMQLTSADTLSHKSLIKQLNNLTEGWGDTVSIEVVCHGPGLNFLHAQKTGFANEIKQLQNKGVEFVACENTMKERKIAKEELLPELTYVKMGIGEIVIKQEQGWSYIKAGF